MFFLHQKFNSANGDLHDIWLDFIVQFKELENLRLIIDINDDQLGKIRENLRKLTEITITITKYLSIENVIEFIAESHSTREITFLNLDTDKITVLSEKFAANWTTSVRNGNYFMERILKN